MTKLIPKPSVHGNEWWLARRGKLSASRISTVVHGGPRGWTTLMNTLDAEKEMPAEPQRFDRVPDGIQWGWDHEPYAIANLEFDYLIEATRPPFTLHPDIPQFGATSDFLVPDLGVNGEVKCFYTQSNHIDVLMNRQIPAMYYPQVQAQMAIHGYDRTWFVSYDPRHPDWKSRLVKIVVERDNSYIDRMLQKIAEFLAIYNRGDRPGSIGSTARTITVKRFF